MYLKFKTPLFILVSLLLVSLLSCEKENGNKTMISSNGSNESHHSGQNCMSCHKEGSSGEGWFQVAGTVYDKLRTTTYPNTAVKLFTGSNGTGTLKYTIQGDALGNFYTTENINFGSSLYVAVQGNTTTKYMNEAITVGQCNNCHGSLTSKIWTE